MAKESELLMMKRRARGFGLCDKYRVKWDGCKTKKDLVDIALDSQGMDFIADSIAFGWGLSKEYMLSNFGEFANGFYQRRKDGYTSEMYIGAHEVVNLKSTLTLVAYCDDLEIHIPEHCVGQIFICGGSKVRIENRGFVELYEYGSNDVEYFEYSGADSTLETIRESRWNNSTADRK